MSRLEPGNFSCNSRTVDEPLLESVALQAINQTLGDKDAILRTLEKNITKVVTGSNAASIEEIDQRLEKLQQELLSLANTKSDYDKVASEILTLRDLKKQSQTDGALRDESISRITVMHDFIRSQPAEITTFDEKLVRRMIERITVHEESFTVEFKSGFNVRIEW